jgi:hypothetical protein
MTWHGGDVNQRVLHIRLPVGPAIGNKTGAIERASPQTMVTQREDIRCITVRPFEA